VRRLEVNVACINVIFEPCQGDKVEMSVKSNHCLEQTSYSDQKLNRWAR
jgi:hypothetical protein